MALVSGATPSVLLRQPDAAAEGIARIEPGVLVKVLQCPEDSDHCRVEAQRFQGWLPRAALWGLLPGEHVD
jgi:SH3-like domain-containing protein